MTFTEGQVPGLAGRTIFVTGANTGIGFAAARVLAAGGARVLLGCRDAARAQAALAIIRAECPMADLDHVALDQADLGSVREAAARVAQEPRLDVLVNNAGVMVPPFTRTRDGFELQFGVNHLGTFALTGLLLDKLAEGKAGRVVVTSSLAHRNARIMWDNVDAAHGYNAGRFYGQSKLANLLFVLELDRRLRAAGSRVRAIGCHPGVSPTELMRNVPSWARPIMAILRPLFNSVAAAAWPTLQAATDPSAAGGDYYGPQGLLEMRGRSGPARIAANAQDRVDAAQLWDLSIAKTGVDPRLPPA